MILCVKLTRSNSVSYFSTTIIITTKQMIGFFKIKIHIKIFIIIIKHRKKR